VGTAKELRTFGGEKGHQNLVLDVAFAPDGQTFASASSDSTVKIWDVPLSKAIRELACSDAVTAIAGMADGKGLAAASKDGSIKIWKQPRCQGEFPSHRTRRRRHGIGVQRQWPAACIYRHRSDAAHLEPNQRSGRSRDWRASVGSHGAGPFPNGNAVYTAGADGTLKVWQLPPVASRPLAGHGDAVQALAVFCGWSAHGHRLCRQECARLPNRQWTISSHTVGAGDGEECGDSGRRQECTDRGRDHLWSVACMGR